MSTAKEIMDSTKINIDRYGFFFWLILFGFIDIIVSVIYNNEYVSLGIIFCIAGITGYVASDLLDRISWGLYKATKPDGTEYAETPVWYHIISAIVKIIIFFLLFLYINKKYPFL